MNTFSIASTIAMGLGPSMPLIKWLKFHFSGSGEACLTNLMPYFQRRLARVWIAAVWPEGAAADDRFYVFHGVFLLEVDWLRRVRFSRSAV